ncbi:MAG: lipoprotein insertase outer membrane protein LolB, partial [Candidatus Eutrophobiaceae bacterium]
MNSMRMGLLAACLSIAGCAGKQATFFAPPTPGEWDLRTGLAQEIHSWELNGRIATRSADGSHSGSFHWQRNHTWHAIEIRGPMGQGGIHIQGERGSWTAQADNGISCASEELTSMLRNCLNLSLNFPIAALEYWILGIPSPMLLPKRAQWNAKGHLTSLSQSGHEVSFKDYQKLEGNWPIPMSLPRKIFMRAGDIELRIAIH